MIEGGIYCELPYTLPLSKLWWIYQWGGQKNAAYQTFLPVFVRNFQKSKDRYTKPLSL